MSESYATREAAMQAAMAQVLEAGEPVCVYACRCDRQDLHDMADAERSAVMAGCAQCERVLIGEAGRV